MGKFSEMSDEHKLLLAISDTLRGLHPHLDELHEAVAAKFAPAPHHPLPPPDHPPPPSEFAE